MYLDNL